MTNQTTWTEFTEDSMEAINSCKLVKLLRKDGQESFVLNTPLMMNEMDIETTTHWRNFDE